MGDNGNDHRAGAKDIVSKSRKHFGLAIPKACPGVPGRILRPKGTWKNPADYVAMANKLTAAFHENFAKYSDKASQAVIDAGPA